MKKQLEKLKKVFTYFLYIIKYGRCEKEDMNADKIDRELKDDN